MNPVRAMVPTSDGGDALFLDPPSPRIAHDSTRPRARTRLSPRSILDSVRYDGLGGSLRKVKLRRSAKGVS